jgi:hypothetical protein
MLIRTHYWTLPLAFSGQSIPTYQICLIVLMSSHLQMGPIQVSWLKFVCMSLPPPLPIPLIFNLNTNINTLCMPCISLHCSLNSNKIHLLGYTHTYTLFYVIYSPDDGPSRAETCQRNVMLNNREYTLPNKCILLELNN